MTDAITSNCGFARSLGGWGFDVFPHRPRAAQKDGGLNRRARELRFRRIREIGCLCCLSYGKFTHPEVHHLNLGGHAGQKRRGDEYTIGLCAWHHRSVPGHFDSYPGPSLAKEPGKFRITFGSDDQLLAEQNKLIAQAEEAATGWRKP